MGFLGPPRAMDAEWFRRAAAGGAEARIAAEESRHATIDAVAATADSLHATLEQMKFLEEARLIVRAMKDAKPTDVN